MLGAVVDVLLILAAVVLVVRAFIHSAALGIAFAVVAAFFARAMIRDAIRSVRWSRVAAGWEDGRRPAAASKRGVSPDLTYADPGDGAEVPLGDDRAADGAGDAPALIREPAAPAWRLEPAAAEPTPPHADAAEGGAGARPARDDPRQLPLPLAGAPPRRDGR